MTNSKSLVQGPARRLRRAHRRGVHGAARLLVSRAGSAAPADDAFLRRHHPRRRVAAAPEAVPAGAPRQEPLHGGRRRLQARAGRPRGVEGDPSSAAAEGRGAVPLLGNGCPRRCSAAAAGGGTKGSSDRSASATPAVCAGRSGTKGAPDSSASATPGTAALPVPTSLRVRLLQIIRII